MDNRVSKFLTEIMNGTEPNAAIENSGVGEMDLRDVLVEIAGVWNVNLLESLINHPKWNEVSDKIADYQKLRDAINTIKEMDKALDSLRENESESNE